MPSSRLRNQGLFTQAYEIGVDIIAFLWKRTLGTKVMHLDMKQTGWKPRQLDGGVKYSPCSEMAELLSGRGQTTNTHTYQKGRQIKKYTHLHKHTHKKTL